MVVPRRGAVKPPPRLPSVPAYDRLGRPVIVTLWPNPLEATGMIVMVSPWPVGRDGEVCLFIVVSSMVACHRQAWRTDHVESKPDLPGNARGEQ